MSHDQFLSVLTMAHLSNAGALAVRRDGEILKTELPSMMVIESLDVGREGDGWYHAS